ncbi:MAG: HAD-IA family hydrolase [Verrucomicrobiota bacterium]
MKSRGIVFFDAGNTMLYPRISIGKVYARYAEHYGIEADSSVLDRGFRDAWKALKADKHKVIKDTDDKLWWKELVRQSWIHLPLPSHFPFDDYFESVYEAFALPQLWKVYPDLWPTLEILKEVGIQCGILSNWDRRLYPVLKGHGLFNRFDPIVISSEVGFNKPDPRIFRYAEQISGFSADECLLIGDDQVLDGEGARAVGWSSLILDRPRLGTEHVLDQILEKTT